MYSIFLGLTPFIFITLLGFVFGRLKIFDLSHAKVLNLFLFYVAVPALIIKFVAQSEISQVDLKQIVSYFLMQASLGFLTFLITKKFFKRPVPESIIWALMVALSNHVTLLLPITKIYFGTEVITQDKYNTNGWCYFIICNCFFFRTNNKKKYQVIIVH